MVEGVVSHLLLQKCPFSLNIGNKIVKGPLVAKSTVPSMQIYSTRSRNKLFYRNDDGAALQVQLIYRCNSKMKTTSPGVPILVRQSL